ncbi:Metallo-dependent hydrolase [Piedraia hortae CBS 480.64]|uniref:Metallo-dependent hydrolase n=1 Tax=Piedraia hortae CBS 480.64 TaxID=1314780 RepID=A0A6A7BZ33_9PEZI|nr:Metallo-dependent hydrolase [Piedraia hortae CBS 480.64]
MDFPWHIGVFDAHCHPTDTLSSLPNVPGMRCRALTVMATRAQDQDLVADAAQKFGLTASDVAAGSWSAEHKIVPAFGWHPWFSHEMFDENDFEGAIELSYEQRILHYQKVLVPSSDDRNFLLSLPAPKPFGDFLNRTKEHLSRHPLALVGEVGLDRSFRIPEAWLPSQVGDRNGSLTPGGREGRRLSPYRVNINHQRKVLLAQLRLAADLQRAVSVHGVAAHGIVYETIAETWKGFEVSKKRKPKDDENLNYPPRICMHSYSGQADTVKQYTASSVPCKVFFSFSTTINKWSEEGDGKVEAALKAVPDERVLVESDLHVAGEQMDECLEQAVRMICRVKGWELETGLVRLAQNWRQFVLGR